MENQTQVTPIIQPEPQLVKNNNFLVILLSILLFISIAIAGFFAFQTQKLNKELKSYSAIRIENEQLKEEVRIVSELKTKQTQVNTIPEFTSGWKNYTSSKLGVSLKVPESVEIVEDISPDGSFSIRSWEPQFIEIYIGIEKKSVQDLIKYYDGQLQKQGTIILGSSPSDVYVGYGGEGGSYLNKAVWIQKNDKVYQMYSGTLFNDSSAEKIADQILSTFKFTN